MAQLRILADCIVSGAHHSAGEVIEASEDDTSILIGCGRAQAVEAAPAAAPTKPKPRTKAEIAADLAAAQAAEAKLQADLTQATE